MRNISRASLFSITTVATLAEFTLCLKFKPVMNGSSMPSTVARIL